MKSIYFTEKELARRWGISHRTLQRWRSDNNGLPYTKFGRHVRYPLSVIQEFEEKHIYITNNK